jgi:hypothetical protein
VAYELEIPDGVLAYLEDLPLSDAAKEKVFAALDDISNLSDAFRADPDNRLSPGSPCLWYRHLLHDREGDGCVHCLEFVVEDGSAQYGILRIRYAEHRPGLPL